MFSLQQNQRRGWNRFCLEAGYWGAGEDGREVAQTMYTHVRKCKNDKIKGGEKKKCSKGIHTDGK
jgi:hypothetical protein